MPVVGWGRAVSPPPPPPPQLPNFPTCLLLFLNLLTTTQPLLSISMLPSRYAPFASSLMSLLSVRTKTTDIKRAPQTGPWRETKPGSRDGGQGQEAHRHCSGLHTSHCTAQVCAIITYHHFTVLYPPPPQA
jgi:hypothetical protein